jgi:hypothetical protein
MAVQSGNFGGLRLTGDDAKKFVNQVRHANKNRVAAQVLNQGSKTAAKLVRDGFVKL